LLNKCRDLVVAVPVDPEAVVDVDRVALLLAGLGMDLMADPVDLLVLPIDHHLHLPMAEASNEQTGEKSLESQPN